MSVIVRRCATDGNVWRPAHSTLEQAEERRLAAAALLRQGRLSQADIARHVGVSRARVCRWAATLAQEGPRGLVARPNLGPPARLDEKAWTRLGRLLDRGALAAGFATERWTFGRIAALIEREFGIHYHPCHLERPLKAHGFSVQRPAIRARERDELVIAVWPKRDWVGVEKGAPGAPHVPPLGRDRPGMTWARLDPAAAAGKQAARGVERGGDHAGRTAGWPPLPHLHLEPLCHPSPAICPPEGRHTAAGGLGSAECSPLTSHQRLHRGTLGERRGGLSAGRCAMANALPGSVIELHRLARHEFSRLHRRPEFIANFFRHTGLSVAGLP